MVALFNSAAIQPYCSEEGIPSHSTNCDPEHHSPPKKNDMLMAPLHEQRPPYIASELLLALKWLQEAEWPFIFQHGS